MRPAHPLLTMTVALLAGCGSNDDPGGPGGPNPPPDTPPVLTVEQPLYGDVARPTVHFKATCVDDDPGGCVRIFMSATDIFGNFSEPMFSTSASSVETDVSLEGITPGKVLQIGATDRGGQTTVIYRNVIEETPSAAVQPLIRVPGRIMDVSDESILYSITDQPVPDAVPTTVAIVRRDRQTGVNDTLATGPAYVSGVLGPFGLLGPPGIVLLYRQSLIELRNGVETDLGPATNVHVTGAYAIWGIPGTGPPFTHRVQLVRRDLAAGTTSSVLDPTALDVGGAVAADGDVTWSNASFEIWWYQNETGAVRISPDGTHNSFPVTDGQQVLYAREASPGVSVDLIRHDAAGESTVASGLPSNASESIRYAATNGWIAFPRLDEADRAQIWTRSPSGVEQQVTHVDGSLLLVALGPAGEVAYFEFSSGGEFLARPPYGPAIPVGTTGEFRFEGSRIYKIIGTTLFTVTP